jgi:3-oxoacyl-[acyl-carrier protein] reductase
MGVLDGKVAIVTGASKGIGAAIAIGFGEAGASVVVNYTSSRDGAERTVGAIRSRGGNAVAARGDVSKETDVAKLFADADAAYGTLDILVNNAAVYTFGPLESVTQEEFRRHFDTNVLGIYFTIKEAVKRFGDKGGSIINIGTAGTRSTRPNSVLYTSTKGAVDIITSTLAKELGPRRIRVNSLNPGGTDTEGARGLGLMRSSLIPEIVAATPLGRFGEPQDMAPVAVFLASDASHWITGELIHVTGGH